LLWPAFDAVWPTNGPGKVGGNFEPMGAWGLPFLNTLILLSSGVSCTWAHHDYCRQKQVIVRTPEEGRSQLIKGLIVTVALGFLSLHCRR